MPQSPPEGSERTGRVRHHSRVFAVVFPEWEGVPQSVKARAGVRVPPWAPTTCTSSSGVEKDGSLLISIRPLPPAGRENWPRYSDLSRFVTVDARNCDGVSNTTASPSLASFGASYRNGHKYVTTNAMVSRAPLWFTWRWHIRLARVRHKRNLAHHIAKRVIAMVSDTHRTGNKSMPTQPSSR